VTASHGPDTIRRFYEAVNANKSGGSADLTDFFTEDAVWHLPRSSPIYGTVTGRDAVVNLFEGPVDDYYQPGTMTFDYHLEICHGDLVAMQFTLSAITAMGDHYENDYCIIFRFRDGLIAEAREFFDTALLFSMIRPGT
jgi:ketosteroid isomerase-like protein